MPDLFFKTPGTASLVSREIDPDVVHPKPEDVVDTVEWTGTGIKVWQDDASKVAKIQQSLNIVYSHSCNGVPKTVEVKTGQLLLLGGSTYRVVLPVRPQQDGFFDMGWLLYLKES